jgi:hypothetical protein
MARKPIQIDHDKLRAALRKLRADRVFCMLADVIDLLPPAKLYRIASEYLDVEQLQPDEETLASRGLLDKVRHFQKASLAGEYYESFNVNSKNYRQQSTGTSAWIAEYRRLLDCCVTNKEGCVPAEVREAMDILFGLLDHIDEGRDDVIFFADEGGSWQVGVDWAKVLPVWFRMLSATADPEEYARRIRTIISHRCSYGRDKMLVLARRSATALQRKALVVAAAD